ncbi:MAG: hypothetical protein KGY40_07830, partial [Thioalkalivibrio sp.]|nr:hypothetical protein [Thioalkalivibrio sp.]
SLGDFSVPFEIVAPADPSLGNGTVLVKPPHFLFPPSGRDLVLGRDLLFGRGFSYASVGFGEHALNILDPNASELTLAGEPVANPGAPNPTGTLDEEVVIQFAEALTSSDFAAEILGAVDRRYAYGVSQTAAVLLETQRNVAGTDREDLFDFTLLHTALWRSSNPGEAAFDFLGGQFAPVEGIGKVLFIESEGDQVISAAEQFRRAVGKPGYRVYEVAGAAHLPTPSNPLDHNAIVRALFLAGDQWVRNGMEPPASALLEEAPEGEVDPVYADVDDPRIDSETGIARDEDLNALGGVRLPDLEVGRAIFVASDPDTRPPFLPPFQAILTGMTVDLACEPAAGSDSDKPRFRNHGDYVNRFSRQVNELVREGLLLADDAEAMKERAAESDVGKPGSCD